KVSRDIQAQRDVVPQGRVVYADEKVKLVTVNIGSFQGVKKGMVFEVYSGSHVAQVKKGRIEITEVNPRSSNAIILGPKLVKKVDPNTFWESTNPKMKYSV